jgi:PAS domain S-box-containing protein
LLGRVQFVLINREMRQTDQPGMGLEIYFEGQRHFITADRLQILNLLLSTYEAAVRRNKELSLAQDTLQQSNSKLEQLTLQLENRVLQRTQELELINEALRESEARLALIIDTALDAVVTMDAEGFICDWNAQAEVIFGWQRNDAVGKRMVELIVPTEHREAHERGIKHFLASGDGPWLNRRIELSALRRDGREFPVELSIAPVRVDGTWNFSAFARDITDRLRAERKLKAQVERLSLLQHITRAIGERQDLQSIFQVVIRSLEDHLALDFACVCLYDQADNMLTVTNIGVRSQSLALELALTELARIALDQNGLSRCVNGELICESDISESEFAFPQRLNKAGLRSFVAAPLQVEGKVFGILIVARRQSHSFSVNECEFLRQLTEHVALAAHQSQLHQSLQQAYEDLRQTHQFVTQQERLRALGQMASGIAHDINNAISPVALYTENLLETEANLSERGRGYLETIQRAIDDVAETVARMREFYRDREPQLTFVPVQVNDLVPQVINLTRARWSDMTQERGTVIKLVTELEPDLPAILGVESEIREALVNLIFNAVDAMPAGGTLTLRTSTLEERDLHSPRVQVEVIDTGLGMDEETQRRCLEPFYTSKGERGTGLGLATVYGMVQRQSAEIEIESAVGKGTTIRLSFAVPDDAAAQPEPLTTGHAVPTPQRILVVDDDPMVLNSLCETLMNDGHEVVAANGGQEGIDTFRTMIEHEESFAVVITDLGMPYVDGRQVASAVKSLSPSTPVILFTGWGRRLLDNDDIPPHVDLVLSKPPKLLALREALAKLCAPETEMTT